MATKPTSADFDSLFSKYSNSKARVEALTGLLDPDIAKPKPSASPSKVDLGSISSEGEKSVSVTIKNSSRGYLSGSISLSGNGQGITVNQTSIEGGPVTVSVRARALGLPAGSRQTANISVSTNGGTLQIPVSFTVSAPVFRMIGRSLAWGCLWALGFWLFRLCLGSISGISGNLLPWLSSGDQLQQVNGGGVFFISIIFFGGLFAYLYYMARMRRVSVLGSSDERR